MRPRERGVFLAGLRPQKRARASSRVGRRAAGPRLWLEGAVWSRRKGILEEPIRPSSSPLFSRRLAASRVGGEGLHALAPLVGPAGRSRRFPLWKKAPHLSAAANRSSALTPWMAQRRRPVTAVAAALYSSWRRSQEPLPPPRESTRPSKGGSRVQLAESSR